MQWWLQCSSWPFPTRESNSSGSTHPSIGAGMPPERSDFALTGGGGLEDQFIQISGTCEDVLPNNDPIPELVDCGIISVEQWVIWRSALIADVVNAVGFALIGNMLVSVEAGRTDVTSKVLAVVLVACGRVEVKVISTRLVAMGPFIRE